MTRPTRIKGGWEVRLRVGKGRRETFRLPDLDESVAQNRADRLERIRALLVDAKKYEDVTKLLAEAARVADDEALFDEAELVAQEIAGGKSLEAMPLTPRTFRDVCDLWTSGELHKRYPHRVKAKRPKTVAKDKARLERICETIGSIPITRVTEDDCDRAIAALPPELRESTRSKYAQLLSYVLRLAASPLKLIKATPLPEEWVPSAGERDEFQMLYPDEEARLIRCPELTTERKYFWGLLARTGMRVDELERAVRGDLDLERGSWKVTGKNSRGGRPKVRRFGLSVDVWEALRVKLKNALPGDPIVSFGDDTRRAAEFFRVDLSDCGIDRRELHETTAAGRRIRAHDLRGTFVSLALAQGRSDQWIMDRTGHSQSQQLRQYDRDSRFAADRKLGWFEDLDVLLGVGERVARATQKPRENEWESESSADFSGGDTLPSQPETAAERQPHDAEEVVRHPGARGGQKSWPSGEGPTTALKTKGAEGAADLLGPASAQARARSGQPSATAEEAKGAEDQPGAGTSARASAPVDPVEKALAFALEEATKAQRWDVVLEVTRELQRRQVASKPEPGVVSLDTRRKRNGDQ